MLVKALVISLNLSADLVVEQLLDLLLVVQHQLKTPLKNFLLLQIQVESITVIWQWLGMVLVVVHQRQMVMLLVVMSMAQQAVLVDSVRI